MVNEAHAGDHLSCRRTNGDRRSACQRQLHLIGKNHDHRFQGAVIDIDQDRLANAPGFEKENWPDMADNTWADEIQRHYGVSGKGCND